MDGTHKSYRNRNLENLFQLKTNQPNKQETHFLIEKENVYETSKHHYAYELDERNLAFRK